PAPKLREVRPDGPPALHDVIIKLLAKNPAERYPSAKAVASALAPFCKNLGKGSDSSNLAPVKRRQVPWRELARPGTPRAWLALGIITGSFVIICAVTILIWLSNHSQPLATAESTKLQPMPTVDKDAVYKAMRLVDFKIVDRRYRTGDTVRFQVRFVNQSNQAIFALPMPMEKSSTGYGIGFAQFWIERLGNDDSIPAITNKLRKEG